MQFEKELSDLLKKYKMITNNVFYISHNSQFKQLGDINKMCFLHNLKFCEIIHQ
jgi:hypothetical protein